MKRFLVAISLLVGQLCFGAMNIALIGPPGSGKGTLAKIIQGAYSIPHISSGDIIRQQIRAGTEFGKTVADMAARGELLPDGSEHMEKLLQLVKNRVMEPDCDDGFVIDGMPRSVFQAERMEQILIAAGRPIGHVIILDLPEETVLSRLTLRLSCPGCGSTYHQTNKPPKSPGICDEPGCGSTLIVRDDDKEEVIRYRLEQYNSNLAPLLDFYKYRRGVLRLSTEQPADQVTQTLLHYLADPFPRNYLQGRIPVFEDTTRPGVRMYNLVEIFKDVGLMQFVATRFSEIIERLNPDYLAAPEARSLPFLGAVADRTNKPSIVIRKSGKIPSAVPKLSESYTTAYSTETLEMTTDPDLKGKTVVMIDDGISSGGTTLATVRLLEKAGLRVIHVLAVIQYHYRSLCDEYLERGLGSQTTTLMDLN